MKKLFILTIASLCSVAAYAVTPVEVMERDSVYLKVLNDGASTLSCYLSYPQGGYEVLRDFENNAGEIGKLDVFMQSVFADTLIYVSKVHLVGYSSIEGRYDFNEQLSKNRVNAFLSYLNSEYQLSQRYDVDVDWVAEDWDRLRELIAESDTPAKNTVTQIIDNVGIFAGREKILMDLDGGRPYKYMYSEFFPLLRRVEITMEYDLHRIIEERYQVTMTDDQFSEVLAMERATAQAAEAAAEAEAAHQKTLAEEKMRQAEEEEARRVAYIEELRRQEQERENAATIAEEAREAEKQRRIDDEKVRAEAREIAKTEEKLRTEEARRLTTEARFQEKSERSAVRREKMAYYPKFAVKSNIVPFAGVTDEFEMKAVMPNLAFEMFYGDRWSTAASAAYSYWEYGSDRDFWGISAYGVEQRLWVNNNGMYKGLFVGLYGNVGDFDVRKPDENGVYGLFNDTGDYWDAGLSVGYHVRITPHFGVEIGLRGGYMSYTGDRYNNIDDPAHNWYIEDISGNKFGLTGANVSLSYRFGNN